MFMAESRVGLDGTNNVDMDCIWTLPAKVSEWKGKQISSQLPVGADLSQVPTREQLTAVCFVLLRDVHLDHNVLWLTMEKYHIRVK